MRQVIFHSLKGPMLRRPYKTLPHPHRRSHSWEMRTLFFSVPPILFLKIAFRGAEEFSLKHVYVLPESPSRPSYWRHLVVPWKTKAYPVDVGREKYCTWEKNKRTNTGQSYLSQRNTVPRCCKVGCKGTITTFGHQNIVQWNYKYRITVMLKWYPWCT